MKHLTKNAPPMANSKTERTKLALLKPQHMSRNDIFRQSRNSKAATLVNTGNLQWSASIVNLNRET